MSKSKEVQLKYWEGRLELEKVRLHYCRENGRTEKAEYHEQRIVTLENKIAGAKDND